MPKRILQGTVVSDKGDKTVVVSVERRFTDPVMKKTVRKSKRYHCLLYTSPSPRDGLLSRMPSSA